MKPIQRDLCVLYLAERGDWVRAVELKGKAYKQYFLGSESDRRMQEVMEVVNSGDGKYHIGSTAYTIEQGSEGKFKTYRVIGATKKVQEVEYVMKDGQRFARLIEKYVPA